MQHDTPPSSAETDVPSSDTPATLDPNDDLQSRLKAAEEAAAEHHDAWLRAKAETENVRRRAAEEADKARKFAVEGFAGELLAVKDSLEAALADSSASPDKLREGVELTHKQLAAVFAKFGLLEINPLGEKFDPHRHQAIQAVESEAPANTVVTVLQKGYCLHDRTLRPALVMVARGKDA